MVEAVSSPQPIWQKVMTLKKGSDGIYITDPKTGLFSQKSYVVNTQTGALYWDEDQSLIAWKCFKVFCGAPFYIAGIMAWNFGKAFIEPLRIGLAHREVVEIPKAVALDLWDVVRAPIYGLGMMLTALYGICDPYTGREYEATVENALMHEVSYKEDFRNKKREEVPDCWPELIYGIQNAQAFYLAYCFQIRGNINDPRITIISKDQASVSSGAASSSI